MKVKVCGMREQKNIEELIKLNPDFMGFIFYELSKRYVKELPAIDIPESIKTVGVFVNEDIAKIMNAVKINNLKGVQLHGNESPKYCKDLKVAFHQVFDRDILLIKAFAVDEHFDFETTKLYSDSCSCFLFDTAGPGYGGTGRKFNWTVLESYKEDRPFLLSGGIQPSDYEVINNMNHPQFLGIDINSGFEEEPGVKRINEIRKFKASLR